MAEFENGFALEATQLQIGTGGAEEPGSEQKRFGRNSLIIITDPALQA